MKTYRFRSGHFLARLFLALEPVIGLRRAERFAAFLLSHRPFRIAGSSWWTPYVETPWGYFHFAVRPEEQPDGVILFWHDADGGHSQHVAVDRP